MPRLPDYNDLGGRPTPNGQQPVTSIRTGQVAQAVANFGETLSGVGDQIYARNQREREKADKFSYAKANSGFIQEKIAALSDLGKDQDYPTYEKRFQERMQKAKESSLELVTDPSDRQMLEEQLNLQVAQGLAEVQKKAWVEEVDAGRADLDFLNSNNRAAYLAAQDEATRVQIIKSTAEAIEGARRKGYLSSEEATKRNQAAATDFALGAFDMRSYADQLKELSNPKSIVHRVVPADVLANRKQRAESHLRVEADRREAKAERALLEVDRQIMSGIPATPQQWQEWQGKIAGTPLEGEFAERIHGEREIQEVLRLPVREQITYVQQKEAGLYSSGGSVRDAANLNRLKGAVTQNVKQLQESPLLYSQSRTGIPVDPIDTDMLLNDDGRLADVMTDRAATIKAMRKEYGPDVSMRPLLPQEAQALSGALANASPEEQVSLFQTLYQSMGDQRVYEGAMQQIAPDSPVRARAGLLAGYTGSQVLSKSWLGPDQQIDARQAATRMLIGENILNQTKGSGKIDGKPVDMPVPPDSQFFENLPAGFLNTFEGRLDALQRAMQSVRAYYVGRQAQTGEFSKEIDPRLLNESITSSLGAVAQYNGGDVLLPWGMDESAFRDKIAAAISTSSMPDEQRQIAQQLRAVNFGANSYILLDSSRRPFLANGQPLVINMESQP